MEKKKTNVLIIVLISIIVILLLCCIVLFMKNEYLDEKYEKSPSLESNEQSSSPSLNNQFITKEEAIDIALKDIGLTKNDVYDLEVELERKYNDDVYEVNFDYNYLDYEYYINAKDGHIIKSFSERD